MIENYTDVIKLSVLYVSRVCVMPGCRANQMHLPAEHRVVARGKHSPEQSIGASSHHWHRTETALRGVRSGAAARHILPSIRAEANGHLAVGARRTAPRGCLPCPNGAAGQGFGVSRAVLCVCGWLIDVVTRASRARSQYVLCRSHREWTVTSSSQRSDDKRRKNKFRPLSSSEEFYISQEPFYSEEDLLQANVAIQNISG